MSENKVDVAELIAETWQDISTAPRDGTRIVLIGPAWNGTRPEHPTYASVGFWFDGGWREVADPDVTMWPPTHWIPLPAPATSTHAEEG